ncbi:MAG: GAF domain-containing protein [Myxococcota bacterium]
MFLIDIRTHESFELWPGLVIGRDPHANIVLSDRTVSRRHAEVVPGDEGLMLKDLNSRRGTLIDQQKIELECLKPGCVVSIGDVRFSVSDSAESTISLDPRIAPLSKLEFLPARDIHDPIALRNDYERLRVVFEMTQAIDVEADIDRILQRILTTAFRLLSAERGVIELFESTGLARTVAYTLSGPATDLQLSQTVVQQVVREQKGLIVSDAQTHAVFGRADSICADGVRSVMCVPLIHDDRVVGVIQVDSVHATYAFQEMDLILFSTIASRAAVVIKDVSARRAAVSARESEYSDLRRVLASMPWGVVVLRPTNHARAINSRGQQVLRNLAYMDRESVVSIGDHSIEKLRSEALTASMIVKDARGQAACTARAVKDGEDTILYFRPVDEAVFR